MLKEEGFFRPQEPMVLSFEVKPWKNEDPEIILANTKRVINRAQARLITRFVLARIQNG